MARLKEFYKQEAAPALMKKFNYKSVMQIPKLDKIVSQRGRRRSERQRQGDRHHHARISLPSPARSPWFAKRKNLWPTSNCVLGMNIGLKVTLRGERMYEFIDRLFNVALPRVRDFRGINPNSFDGRGNYNLGIREQLIFPEIDYR